MAAACSSPASTRALLEYGDELQGDLGIPGRIAELCGRQGACPVTGLERFV